MHSRDRSQGMFTYADRAYLLGETEPRTAAAERKKRQRIRERLRNAIIDFSLLVHVEWHDLDIVFSELVDDDGELADQALYDGIVEMIETVLRNTTLQGLSWDRIMRLAMLRSLGVYFLFYEGILLDVDFTQDVRINPANSVRLSDAPRRLESLDDVPLAALLALEEFGITTLDELYAISRPAP